LATPQYKKNDFLAKIIYIVKGKTIYPEKSISHQGSKGTKRTQKR